jgi:hypothetical protein
MQEKKEDRSGEEGTIQEKQTASGEGALSGETPSTGEPSDLKVETIFRVTGASFIYRYFFITLLTLMGAVILYMVAPTYFSSKDVVVLILLAVWALAFLRYWVYLLDMPYKVICRDDGSLVFVSVFRNRVVWESSILSMKVSPIYPTYMKFRTEEKKTIAIINHVDGMNELVARIRKANPGLETRGC